MFTSAKLVFSGRSICYSNVLVGPVVISEQCDQSKRMTLYQLPSIQLLHCPNGVWFVSPCCCFDNFAQTPQAPAAFANMFARRPAFDRWHDSSSTSTQPYRPGASGCFGCNPGRLAPLSCALCTASRWTALTSNKTPYHIAGEMNTPNPRSSRLITRQNIFQSALTSLLPSPNCG